MVKELELYCLFMSGPCFFFDITEVGWIYVSVVCFEVPALIPVCIVSSLPARVVFLGLIFLTRIHTSMECVPRMYYEFADRDIDSSGSNFPKQYWVRRSSFLNYLVIRFSGK